MSKQQFWLLTVYPEALGPNDHRNVIIYEGSEGLMPKWTSKRGPFESKLKLMKECDVSSIKCRKCGGLIELSYVEQKRKQLEAKSLCFSCDFWDGIKHSVSVDKNRVIIEGASYYIQPDPPPGSPSFKGFGGRTFRIQKDGSDDIITTHNLWHQGEIPKIYLDEIPNNAKFV